MTTKTGTAALFALLLALCGCNDAKLSTYENYALGQVRMQTWKTEEARNHPVSALLRADPEKLAAENAAKGDFRLYGITNEGPASSLAQEAGKPPSPKNPAPQTLLGVTCTPAPEDAVTILNMTCIPPPGIVMKHVLRYNVAMASHPNFPATPRCTVDTGQVQEVDDYMRREEQEWRKSREDRRVERAKNLKLLND